MGPKWFPEVLLELYEQKYVPDPFLIARSVGKTNKKRIKDRFNDLGRTFLGKHDTFLGGMLVLTGTGTGSG